MLSRVIEEPVPYGLWNQLPADLLGCPGATYWQGLRNGPGRVWSALHQLLLTELRATGNRDLDRGAANGFNIRPDFAQISAHFPVGRSARGRLVGPELGHDGGRFGAESR